MAEPFQLAKLGEGAELWNAWRQENSDVVVDLSGANLSSTDLSRADLSETNLSGANLTQANLREANLRGADLRGADFYMAHLSGIRLRGKLAATEQGPRTNFEGTSLRAADLSGVDFNGIRLAGVDLSGANLGRVNLRGVDLSGANLSSADLHRAVLTEADLLGANLRGAAIQDAKLESVKGLVSQQLGDTNLAGITLPDHLKEFKTLDVVKELSHNARKPFISLLVGCLYSWLTIATTTDARLIPNSASSPLPIIGTEIPIASFYFAAPLLLVMVYVYFHLYLHRLWQAFAGLPAVFPDGKGLDEAAYPWLLNSLVRRHFSRLKGSRSLLAKAEELVSIFLAWWVVPLTLVGFWLRYIPRHDSFGTGFQVALLTFSVGWGMSLYRSATRTLGGDDDRKHHESKLLDGCRTYLHQPNLLYRYGVAHWALAVVLGFGVWLVSAMAIGSERGDVLPGLLPWGASANLVGAELSQRPDNYWLIDEKDREEAIVGARLNGVDLHHAKASYAFLARANLIDANLRGAILSEADLSRAYLSGANLSGAGLGASNLGEALLLLANLSEANLSEANLRGANASGANLSRTDLKYAYLNEAMLIRADVSGANLSGADLFETDLSGADLKAAVIEQIQIDVAVGDCETQLPAGLNPPAEWCPDDGPR